MIIAMTKEAFNRKISHLACKLNIEFWKKFVRCYVWSIDLCSSEMWTLKKLKRKYLESFEMGCWRRMERIKWSEKKTTNKEVLGRIGTKMTLLNNVLHRKANWTARIPRRNCLLHDAMKYR